MIKRRLAQLLMLGSKLYLFAGASLGMDPGKVAKSIQHKLDALPEISPNCCVYVVPKILRNINEDAYCPLVVSIGPVYFNDQRLEGMHHQKLRYLKSFITRNPAHTIHDYINVMRRWEGFARQCYVETIPLLSSDLFVKMLLVDAVFIIELFLRNLFHDLVDQNDRIINKPRMILEVKRDLRLLENQLPFIILKSLYELTFDSSSSNQHISFLDLTYWFLMGREEPVPQRILTADIKHLVDFLRLCYFPSTLRPNPDNSFKFEFTSTVTELSEAGVKFVASKRANLLDIRFFKGVLEIPRITVSDETDSLFRNIMAYEQCDHFSDSYIIDYFALLDSLINTPKDVELLSQRGIIENWLGNNEEVVNLFSTIFKQTRLHKGNFYYSCVCTAMNTYASTKWHKWRAILKHDYFNHPWAAISVGYAVVLLILTVLQVYTGFK